MGREVIFIILGYLSGSVLYANVFAGLLGKDGIIKNSRDGNPGTANAFMYGGFLCGILTLAGDILKGFLPVYLYTRYVKEISAGGILAAFVVAAPVIGHGFPVFYKLQGGKGIAVTFGTMIGILPVWQPLAMLVITFIVFSLVLRVTPHFYRTITAYVCTLAYVMCSCEWIVWISFFIITAVVFFKMYSSKEKRERMRIGLIWMH